MDYTWKKKIWQAKNNLAKDSGDRVERWSLYIGKGTEANQRLTQEEVKDYVSPETKKK